MLSQTSLTTRRQFLGRSALGAGSLLMSLGFLQGCTDHLIPDPDPGSDTPLYPPDLGDATTADNWNNGLKTTVTTGLQLVPDVGGFLSAIVDILWPSLGGGNFNTSIYDDIENQVNALIAQANQKLVLAQQKAALEGLRDLINKYTLKVSLGPTSKTLPWPLPDPRPQEWLDIKTAWHDVDTAFTQQLYQFQLAGYEAPLLPLFAQFANLYMAFYRDPKTIVLDANGQTVYAGANYPLEWGVVWGFDYSDMDNVAAALHKGATEFEPYVTQHYTDTLAALLTAPVDAINNEPFNTANQYTRKMTVYVLDYKDTWKYYERDQYPNGSGDAVLFSREIYSDPWGNTFSTTSSSPTIVLPSPATQFPTNITVWSGHQLDAVQLTYPPGGGPGGVTQTARMGDQKGGSASELPLDSVNNPITKFSVSADWDQIDTPSSDTPRNSIQGINTLYFVYSNGYPSSKFGLKDGQFASGEFGYDTLGYALSSIYIQGAVAFFNNTANCIVFGFLRRQKPSDTLKAVARHYITSPKEYSDDELAKAFPKLGLSAKSITNELRAARKAHWEWMKVHYK